AWGEPLRGPDGETWVATQNGWLHAVETPFRKQKWRVAEGSAELLAVSRRIAVVRVEGSVLALARDGKTAWSLAGVEHAAVDRLGAEQAVLVRSGALDFVELETGRVRGSVPYTERVSAAP